MKGNRKRLPALLLVAVLALVALGPVPAAQAGNPNPGVIPPQAHPHGHTYGEWAARYFQWALSIPAATNPLLDESGALCGQGQSGAVWYLPSNIGESSTRDKCVIPPGKSLLLLAIASECEGNGQTEAELRSCANDSMEQATDVRVSVDGVPVTNLASYRFESPLYTLTYPEGAIFGVPPGQTPSVADGYFVMLNPLPPGPHTIYTHGALPGFETEVTYHLKVGH